jgi:hypothetical protein
VTPSDASNQAEPSGAAEVPGVQACRVHQHAWNDPEVFGAARAERSIRRRGPAGQREHGER